VIRAARSSDAAAIAAIYAPIVRDTPISFEVEPPPAAEMAARMRVIVEKFPYLVFEQDGRPLGYAYASKHRDRAAYQWSVEVSVYVDATARRGGVGRALYTELFALLRLQGFYNAYAGITLPNAASVGLHESLGFRRIALYPKIGFKTGGWHDVGWWALDLQPKPAQPAPPKAP
jgi:L-amino acid N-acyltransferase YncA